MHNQNISSFVDHSINSLSWNFDFRRNLNEVEIEEVARLLQKVENIRLSQSRVDNRRWKLDLSGLFSCKSYRSFLSNNGIVQHFPPSSQIWKSKVPPKAKVLGWLVANRKLNTCDQIQRRSPFICLSPHWCSLCKAKEESFKPHFSPLFLHDSTVVEIVSGG
ncbi:hypothetical protein C1H46_043772 [Malus baccata]|uniref:Reverse transcriptase zinc-binding domain-containing protein n=1 Tax=Malus baccata TaxID=106549 RepID=A0A540K908_MALBA|nr:hypothetical protein C1H46_043772 [Malus baccata]